MLMRKIKFSLLAVISSVILLSNISFSQDVQVYEDDEYNCLADKKWSIIFDIGTYFKSIDSGMYKSFTMSGKYHFNKKNALRLSLGIGGSRETGESKLSYSQVVTGGLINENLHLETNMQFIHYLNPDSKVKVYIGLGPYFNFIHAFKSTTDSYGYIVESQTDNKWSIGLAGSLGVEYFILDHISLVGEYFCTGTYSRVIKDYYSYYSNSEYWDTKIDEWGFDMNRMRIGFSVYF
jgi:opacity protein-like surface antigen